MHELFFENLRNPARARRAGLMRQFRSGQLNSTKFSIHVFAKNLLLELLDHYKCVDLHSRSLEEYPDTTTVALIKFASMSLYVKVPQEKKTAIKKKLDGNR